MIFRSCSAAGASLFAGAHAEKRVAEDRCVDAPFESVADGWFVVVSRVTAACSSSFLMPLQSQNYHFCLHFCRGVALTYLTILA